MQSVVSERRLFMPSAASDRPIANLSDSQREERAGFCTFMAESDVPPDEAAALTGHTEAVWWKSYVQPLRDAESRRENIQRMTAGASVFVQVDHGLTRA